MKKNKRSIIPISLLIALVAVFITYASSKLVSNIEAGGQKKGSVGNTKYRELKQNAWGNEPVKIAKLQVAKGKTLELGKKVLAEDDWLRGLTISVTNVSAKNIVYIDLELHFLRSKATELNGESITAFPLSAGNSLEGVRVAGQNNTGHSLIFQPGETLEMSLSDEEYSTLQSHLTKTKHPDSVKDVEIIVREVIFDDTTRWSAGRLFLRNPEQPDMWLPIQQTRDVRRESSSPAFFQKAAWSSSLSSLIATTPQNQCGTPSPG
ncbi:MAG TPA: hypothetical protein VD835_07135 [Pyrinomonadaceae bacterium]|nr:hypothetical protein [Pyrinomonadaceae bacterium]